jgi:hypothetical protein
MPAIMTIDQVGLPAGLAGFARTDGLATGALVTVTSVGGGSTSLVNLLWVPPTDTTAIASLVQTGPTTWEFLPTALVYGTYRIELITDEGLPTESRQIRSFVIRTPNLGLIIPAANEIADNEATLLNNTLATIDRSEQNEAFAPFVTGSSWGWWRAMSEMIMALDAGGGGGVSPVLWEWNGVDTSQFLAAIDLGLGAGIAGLTLTTAAGGPNGTLLRISSTELVAGGVMFPIDFAFPRRYVIEVTWYALNFTDVTNAGTNLAGTIVAADAAGTETLALAHGNITALAPYQPLLDFAISAGVPFGPSLAFNSIVSAQWAPAFGAPQSGLSMRYEVVTQRPFVAATPQIMAAIDGSGSDQVTPQTHVRANGSSQGVPAYPAGWDGVTLDTIGLLCGNGGATTAWTADIESIRVLRHPADL